MHQHQFILTLLCKDDFGIVAAVAGCLTKLGGFIVESAQFGDSVSQRFFMRILFSMPEDKADETEILDCLAPIVARYKMDAHLQAASYRPKTLLLVSQQGHCLNDIMHRVVSDSLPINVVGVVSNHTTLEQMAHFYQIPFHYLPVTKETKEDQEKKLLHLIDDLDVDLVVLARYMQVLSENLTQMLFGKAINIHHSFLPSFKGAKPYHQAFERGVKVIGATAHYVTEDLDEGPIIEQETIRVSHAHTPARLIEMGRDAECVVLARAISMHVERRVLINGNKTVVFG